MHTALRIFGCFVTVLLVALAGYQMGKGRLEFVILDVGLATVLLAELTRRADE